MKFSIISTDYEDWVPRNEVQRGIDSIASQHFTDFEWIIVHDGPKKIPYEEEYDLSKLKSKPVIVEMPQKMGDWGMHGRDYAMKEIAQGDYFIQFNINNMLYPKCLKEINKYIKISRRDIIIFSIMHLKLGHWVGLPGPIELKGIPPVLRNIDLLQLVAHRDIWKEVGYFWDKSHLGDGIVYENMCSRFPWFHIDKVLGENF